MAVPFWILPAMAIFMLSLYLPDFTQAMEHSPRPSPKLQERFPTEALHIDADYLSTQE